MNILSILIIRMRHQPDEVYLNTDLLPSVYPFRYPPNVRLTVGQGIAEEYVEKNFPGIPYEVSDFSKGQS